MDTGDWIEHRRGDGERLGWMRPEGEGFVPVDLLGRDHSDEPLDWLPAEELLDELGIGYLAELYLLDQSEAPPRRVRIAEVSPAGIRVVRDHGGAVGGALEEVVLPWPMPSELRPVSEVPDFDAHVWPFGD